MYLIKSMWLYIFLFTLRKFLSHFIDSLNLIFRLLSIDYYFATVKYWLPTNWSTGSYHITELIFHFIEILPEGSTRGYLSLVHALLLIVIYGSFLLRKLSVSTSVEVVQRYRSSTDHK